jgi:hypothetical protein
MEFPQGKLVVAEFVKKDLSSVDSWDQCVINSCCLRAMAPVVKEGDGGQRSKEVESCGMRLAQDETEIDEAWQDSFEEKLNELVISIGLVDYLSGIAVFEILVYAESGKVLIDRPRRFMVAQRGEISAIYLCDSAAAAFALGKKLLENPEKEILESEAKRVSPKLRGRSPL